MPDANAWISAGAQFGAMGMMLWWLTAKLIPQLQKERSEAIAAFQSEMEKERVLHRQVNAELTRRNDLLTESLLDRLVRSERGGA